MSGETEFTADDLIEMRKEILEFREIIEERRLESYNPDCHILKNDIAEALGISVNTMGGITKKWEDAGIFKKVDIRYDSGRPGVAYILLDGWQEKLKDMLK